MNKPTDRQLEIFRWIRSEVLAYRPPTLQDIAQQFGMKHPSSAEDVVNALERKGLLKRQAGKRRHFEILEAKVI